MTTSMLIDLLYEHVFSWTGLPLSIVGDRDTRLTSRMMTSLCKGLKVKRSLSAAYRPQIDGSTERFNGTFLKTVAYLLQVQS